MTAAADILWRQGDTLPAATYALTDPITGSAVDLTGASVNFVLRSLTAARPGINAPAVIVTPAVGTVSYAPTAADTALPGHFQGCFVVTFSGGAQQTFPSDGYLDVWVEPNLTAAGTMQLIGLAEAKEYLRIDAADRAHDDELLQMIAGIRPLIENITGPVVVDTYEEWHDGGNTFISVHRRPSAGFGTSPVLNVLAISEYNGPQEWPLAIINSPDQGDLYSVLVDTRRGRIYRRTAGGAVQGFPNMPQSVHVWYEAGQETIPANVTLATLECLRENYQQTQQGATEHFGGGALGAVDVPAENEPPPYFLSPRVRAMLSPNRRHPAVA